MTRPTSRFTTQNLEDMNLKHSVALPCTALMAVLALACPLACGGRATSATSPAEASAAGMGSAGDAGSCLVLSSRYDQSCTSDSDCLDVGEVIGCPANTCAFCETGVINKQVEVSYMAAFSAATAGIDLDAGGCFCPSSAGGVPCCRTGLCQQCD